MAHTTNTPAMTNYQPGDRLRYGCSKHLTGTFRRYTDTRPSVLAGRIVEIEPDFWGKSHGTVVSWEIDTSPAEDGDVGSHIDPTTRRYIGPNWKLWT